MKQLPGFVFALLVVAATGSSGFSQDSRGITEMPFCSAYNPGAAIPPAPDSAWLEQRKQYEQALQNYIAAHGRNFRAQTTLTIPVVVHIIAFDSSQLLSDAQVQSQIDVLNQDFSRTNPDTINTPAAFAAVAANTGIQFCLAQRDPNGYPTTGIERRLIDPDNMGVGFFPKQYWTGGFDAWDPAQYFNIWVPGGQAGQGEYPAMTISYTYGAVVGTEMFGTIGNLMPPYTGGRTLTHEVGHCLSLFHIFEYWLFCMSGDSCADTPVQTFPVSGCPPFPVLDTCTGPDGVMFQNYMDYSDDACKNIFTQDQSARMNAVLSISPYNALTTSNVCQPFSLVADDAGMRKINLPGGSVCPTFTPRVTLLNWGSNTLTSCTIFCQVDANPPVPFSWTGSLAPLDSVGVFLNPVTTSTGTHTFTVYTGMPNGNTDAQPGNDQLSTGFYVAPVTALPFSEGFEQALFPPPGWSVHNIDSGFTWARTTQAAQSGSASAMIAGWASNGFDDLLTPTIDLAAALSPAITFDVAYTYDTYPMDTLILSISTDCGLTYTELFRKGGAQLATAPTGPMTNFIPTASQWRFEQVSLVNYLSANRAIFRFRNKTEFGDQLYLDNINIVDANGVYDAAAFSPFTVFPNPSGGELFIRAEHMTGGRLDWQLLNVLGEILASGKQAHVSGPFTQRLDISSHPAGIYFLRLTGNGTSRTVKVVKE